MSCAIAESLQHLRTQSQDATWYIVSGCGHAELCEIFAVWGMDHLSYGGISRGPATKTEFSQG